MMNGERKTIKRSGYARFFGLVLGALSLVCVGGCATPVGVKELGERAAYRQISRSALSSDHYSSFTASVLHRHNLLKAFESSPKEAILVLHGIAIEDDRRDAIFALAELCYLTAEETSGQESRDYYLCTAVYAYLYLLGDGGREPPSPYDRRFRMACDLYNRSLVPALTDENGHLAMTTGVHTVPMGEIRLEMPNPPSEKFSKFVSADRYIVHGLSVRDRIPGLGAPLIAVKKKTKERPYPAAITATVFMRVERVVADLTSGSAVGIIEVHRALEDEYIEIGDKQVPLEKDLTTQLAYTLDNPILWKFGKKLFLAEEKPIKSGLYTTQPYTAGKIPVVFVHGTMSSPIWWAEMLNTLRADRSIREKYQFAFYLYDSGKPVMFSAADLRDELVRYRDESDPDRADPAMQQMVVVGHSQGGLLTKLTATDTGDKIFRVFIDEDLESLDATDEEKALMRRYTHFTALPFVTRTVFISTPHRGSYRAGSFARTMARKFMNLPRDVMDTGGEILGLAEKHNVPKEVLSGMPTSIDSMSPTSPTLLTLAEIPPASHVTAHSIIPIKGDDQPPEGKDGVVAYKSAHVDYVESELIVRDEHSCQQHPETIEEVRRILLLHIAEAGEKAAAR